MIWIKRKVWIARYVVEFRRLVGWGLLESWRYTESSLDNIGYDIDECPVDMVEQDLSYWQE